MSTKLVINRHDFAITLNNKLPIILLEVYLNAHCIIGVMLRKKIKIDAHHFINETAICFIFSKFSLSNFIVKYNYA